MELRQLRYFMAVAQELHFGRAAEQLHLAQQPLSYEIKQLEKELGVRLFDRSTRRVELTDAGRYLLAEVNTAFRHLEQGVDIAQRAGRGEVGHLLVGYASSALDTTTTTIVCLFRERFPGIDLGLRELDPPLLEQHILAGRLDAGLAYLTDGIEEEPGLAHETIYEDISTVALPERHPLARHTAVPWSALASEGLVMRARAEHPVCYDSMVARCENAGFTPRIVQEVASDQGVLSLVSAGLGVAIVAGSVQNRHTSGVVYRPLCQPTVRFDVALIWRAANPSPALQSLVKVAREVAQTPAECERAA